MLGVYLEHKVVLMFYFIMEQIWFRRSMLQPTILHRFTKSQHTVGKQIIYIIVFMEMIGIAIIGLILPGNGGNYK
jgi:hypothetical protein